MSQKSVSSTVTSSSVMAERPRELGNFKGLTITLLRIPTSVSAAADRPASYGNQIISSTRPSCWIQISTVMRDQHCGRLSDVYNTDWRTKLTALETISRWLLLNKRKSAEVGVSRRGCVTFSADFRGKGASPTNRCRCQSSRVIALSCDIKISAVRHLDLSQSTRVTDGQTDRRTDSITTPKTALAYARAVKCKLDLDGKV